MVPKTFLFQLVAAFLLLSISASALGDPPTSAVNSVRPSLRFDFDNCVSFGGGSSADYSEFTAISVENSECSDLSVVGGNLFRINPNRNMHSCAPGLNDTRAMCISSNESCNYNPGNESSLFITVQVQPGPDGVGSLDNFAFFSKAPRTFEFVEGESGLNNYPTRFGVRVIDQNGTTVYQSTDIATNPDWTFRRFDLSAVTEATVSEPTLFRIEILPYCLAGVDSDVTAWDIEDLVITAGCNNVNGGVINTISNTDLCSITQPVRRVDIMVANAIGQSFSYLVVDNEQRIVSVSNSNIVDFTSLPSGIFNIHHIAFEGVVSGLNVGSFLFNLGGCFDLSNPIGVTNRFVTGGNLLTDSGASTFAICPNNNNTIVNTRLQSANGDDVIYILMNTAGMILQQFTSPDIDLSFLSIGEYRLRAISFSGPLVNLRNGSTLAAVSGCFAVSTPLNVLVQERVPGGGTLSASGLTSLQVCDNVSNIDVTLTGTLGQNNDFIVVSPQGRILSLQNSSSVFIGNLTSPEVSIFNISYNNGLTGLVIDGTLSALGGCFELSNPIDVQRAIVSGGNISSFGSDQVALCLRNNESQAVTISATGQAGPSIQYYVTDAASTIIAPVQLNNTNSIDFNNFGVGTCLIYAVASDGPISGNTVGQNIFGITGNCFDISNAITVERNEVESGVLSPSTVDDLCLNRFGSQIVEFSVAGNTGDFNTFIVTDINGDVLITQTGGSVDFADTGAGTCFVYHIAHSDPQITYDGRENINNISLGCFELSSAVSVRRFDNSGGGLTLVDGSTTVEIEISQGETVSLDVVLSNNEGDNAIFAVFDEDGFILSTQTSSTFTFDSNSPSSCSIINVNFGGTLEGLVIGDRIDNLSGCFSVSNRVIVTKIAPVDPVDTLDAGVIVTSDGLTTVDICIGDGSSTSIDLEFSENPVGAFQTFVVTDDNDEILLVTNDTTIEFETTGPGICNVYNIAHPEMVLVGLAVANNLTDLSGAFDLSDPITVTRSEVDGGDLSTIGNMTLVSIIVGDGIIDTIDVNLLDADGDNMVWVITDTLGNILDLSQAPPFTFDDSGSGVCQIWNLSFATGLLGASEGANVSGLEGCFNLSNPITVTKTEMVTPQDTINGGVLTTLDSLTTVDLCLAVEDMIDDVLLSGTAGDTMTFVITDEEGIILVLTDSAPLSFGAAGGGICFLYNINWNDSLTGLAVGEDLDNVTGAFDLSNSITVNRTEAIGGSLTTAGGFTSIDITVGDGVIDSIDVNLTGADADNMAGVITDTLGNILDLPAGPPFTFENAGSAVCQIWNLSFGTGLFGAEVGANVAGLEGCFDLSNPIEVVKTQGIPPLSGGSIMTTDSMTTTSLCLGTNNVTVDVILEGASGDNMAWAITDTSGFIFGTFAMPPFQFSGLPAGECNIVHVSYNDTIIGLEAGQDLDTLSGNFDLSNIITVFRDEPMGGMLETSAGDTTVSILVGDGIIDSIDVNLTGASGSNMAWVITDTLGNILELPVGPPFTFEDFGNGVCQIWNLSFANGLMGAAVGNNVSGLDGCFDLSNPIAVTKTETAPPVDSVSGGILTTMDSLTTADFCLGGAPDSIDVTLVGTLGDTMTYIIADTNGVILDLMATPPFDFAGSDPGICLIYNINWNGSITGLTVGSEIDSLMGLFDLSNAITVTKDEVDGGMILTEPDSLTAVSIIVGDGVIDSIDVSLAMAIGDTTAWVVTDSLGNIIELPAGPPFTFENLGSGVCSIWNISYAFGLQNLTVGNNISALVGCYDLSNAITVTRTALQPLVDGGNIMTVDSMLTADICLGTTAVDVDVILENAVGPNMLFVVTDTTGIIIDTSSVSPIPFDDSFPGVCSVWNISFSGMLDGLDIGQDIDTLGGNFDLSNNIVVTREEVDGGLVMFDDMSFSQVVIVGDGTPDTLDFIVSGIEGDTTAWVLTTTTGTILELSTDPQFIIQDTVSAGVCRVNHISYIFGLEGLEVGNNINIDLDGCSDLSNFVIITKQDFVNDTLIAGVAMTTDSLTMVDLCTGDNGANLDVISVGSNGPSETWVVTDSTGIITNTFAASPIVFATDSAIGCQVRHVVFDSILTGLTIGEDIDTLSGNFLSSNIITVNKSILEASSIVLSDSTLMASVTTADGMTDTLTVLSSGITADTSVYISAGTDGIITVVQDSTEFLFDNQVSGTCLLYEVSYDFEFPGVVTGDDIGDLIGCYAISNAITVTKTSAALLSGGTIFTPTGNDVEVCLSDSAVDSIDVTLASAIGDTMSWVITDTTGVILELPDGPPFAFDNSTPGVCEIHHVSYTAPLTGFAVGGNIDSLGGIFDFANLPVTVDKNFSEGGSLTTATGMTFDTISLGADPIDSLFVSLTGNIIGDTTTWVIADTLGNILDFPVGPPFDFETFPPGQCNLWHLAYADGLSGLQLGNDIDTDLDGCFDFSDSIRVVKVTSNAAGVNSGSISTLDGTNIINVCQGNPEIDSSLITIGGQVGSNFNFFITNTAGFIIRVGDTINTVLDTALVHVESSPNASMILLYHIAYETPITNFSLGRNISTIQGTFDLSNPITLLNDNVEAGFIVNGLDTLDIIVGDGVIDTIDFVTGGNVVGDTSNWVVYDEAGIILEIDSGPPFDFEDSGGGIFNITRVAYIFGLEGLAVGSNIFDLDGCFDLMNNPFVVNAVQATLSGGSLTTIDSLTDVSFCFDSNTMMDSIDVILTDTLGTDFAWVVTDTAGLILDLPTMPPFVIDNMDPDSCFIQNISFEGILTGLTIGEDIDTLAGDFLLSNPITVTKTVVSGGVLSHLSGQAMFDFCVGDGNPDILNLELADTIGTAFQFVIADTTGIILQLPPVGNSFVDFEGFGDGVCRVFNLANADEVLGLVPGASLDSLIGCFDLSNFLTITKNGVDGNIVLTSPASIDNMSTFCVSDGAMDTLLLSTNSTMGSYQYVITDENNEIDSVLIGDFIDFEGSEFGTCRIWGVSFTGTFTGMPGDTVGVQSLASECFDVSNMPITIIKEDCSQPIINEVLGTNMVEIQNIGSAPVDVSTMFLFSELDSEQISDLAVNCGSTLLMPGDLVVIDMNNSSINLAANDGELALFSQSSFGSSDAIVHYVEWGSTPHDATTPAVIAGLWLNSQFAVSFDATTSLKYDGAGNLDSDWSEGTQTPCMLNLEDETPTSRRSLDYLTYPNPSLGSFNLFIPEYYRTDSGQLTIYDSYGKIVMTKDVQTEKEINVDLSSFGTGLYYTKVQLDGVVVVKKILVLD